MTTEGGKDTTSAEKRQEPILIGVWTSASVKWKEVEEESNQMAPFSWWWWMARRRRRPLGASSRCKVWMHFRNVAGEDMFGCDRCWRAEWCSSRADSWARSCDLAGRRTRGEECQDELTPPLLPQLALKKSEKQICSRQGESDIYETWPGALGLNF